MSELGLDPGSWKWPRAEELHEVKMLAEHGWVLAPAESLEVSSGGVARESPWLDRE